MKRRDFLYRTGAGLGALLVAPGCWSLGRSRRDERVYDFQPYRPGETLGPVVQVTPEDGFYGNTYYDIQPWSPSGRYLAVTRFPYQDRVTILGDQAEVCVIDLERRSIRTLHRTGAWGYQLGANLHWGATDRYLYTNDVILRDDGRSHTVAVRIDLETGDRTAFTGPMMDVVPKPDGGGVALGPRMELLNTSQYSYGTPARSENEVETLPPGAAADEGLWETRLVSGAPTRLLLSLADLAALLPNREWYRGGTFYIHLVKLNQQQDRMLMVMRCLFPPEATAVRPETRGRNSVLLTARTDGSEQKLAVPRERWEEGGHHPTWHPDGRRIVMNLTPPGPDDTLRFCLFDYRGEGFTVLSDRFVGSGHPTVTPDTRYLLSDSYPFEPMAAGNGEVPIRLIELREQKEHTVCTVFTDFESIYDSKRYWGVTKLDAHPVWNRDFKQICFNGAPNRTRQVFIADLSGFLR